MFSELLRTSERQPELLQPKAATEDGFIFIHTVPHVCSIYFIHLIFRHGEDKMINQRVPSYQFTVKLQIPGNRLLNPNNINISIFPIHIYIYASHQLGVNTGLIMNQQKNTSAASQQQTSRDGKQRIKQLNPAADNSYDFRGLCNLI